MRGGQVRGTNVLQCVASVPPMEDEGPRAAFENLYHFERHYILEKSTYECETNVMFHDISRPTHLRSSRVFLS